MTQRRLIWLGAGAVLTLCGAGLCPFGGDRSAAPAQAQTMAPTPAPTAIPVGGKLQADNACYVRLPDLPRALYGGFGAYNDETGVLAFAGGNEKLAEELNNTSYEVYGLKLDGKANSWSRVPTEGGVGYLHASRRGCREMGTVRLSASNWLSVLGKDGCDGTADRRGDLKELVVGNAVSPGQVRWRPGSAIEGVAPDELSTRALRLTRMVATYDTQRKRVIFGQGSFDDERAEDTQEEMYSAVNYGGSKWKVSRMDPVGTRPLRRLGSCGAYVHDPATGLDGVLVVGGREGAPKGISSPVYNEAWWLDFSKNPSGEWRNITGRIGNMSDFGIRHEGACAYNPATKKFYMWFGRGSASVPQGSRRTSGLWRIDLGQLADAAAPLAWERLAADNTLGADGGRRLIPSVYDWRNNRLFVLAGRGGGDEMVAFNEVWALYPDVTGQACTDLDPYAPFSSGGLPVTPTTVPVPAPTATPIPGVQPQVCPNLDRVVPQAVINAAVANPASILGWGQLCTPGLAASPTNVLRTSLSLQNAGRPFHPIFNGVVFKCGCP